MILLDGKALAQSIESKIIDEVKTLALKGIVPSLAVILVGNDRASQIYVNMKAKACKRVGITSILHEMPCNITCQDLLTTIQNLNRNDKLDGILVQLPLPSHINTYEILESISPHKDVDGFHTQNSGRLFSGDFCGDFGVSSQDSNNLECFIPATPLGVMMLLSHYKIRLKGADVCIVGASNIVGKPLMALMLNAGASVSMCHIHTKNLSFYTKNADIICVAVGKQGLITGEMIKQDSVIIDIGITRLEGGKVVGDADFESVSKVCGYITPVPGGVGPMTIASLLQNTIRSAMRRV